MMMKCYISHKLKKKKETILIVAFILDNKKWAGQIPTCNKLDLMLLFFNLCVIIGRHKMWNVFCSAKNNLRRARWTECSHFYWAALCVDLSVKQLPLSLLCLLHCSSKLQHIDADSLLSTCQSFCLSASGKRMEENMWISLFFFFHFQTCIRLFCSPLV